MSYEVDLYLNIDGLTNPIHVTGTVTPNGASEPPANFSEPHGLPERVLGVYWPEWENVRFRDLHPHYNTAFIAFLINGGANGALAWNGLYDPGMDREEFITDLQAFRAEGGSVILSVGGADTMITITNTTQADNAFNSIALLFNEWGGFDGIDWDLEHAIDVDSLTYLSTCLREEFGSNFAITMSTYGSNMQYKTLASDLNASGNLGAFAIQFYDYGPPSSPSPAASHVAGRIAEMNDTFNVGPEKFLIGVKHTGDPSRAWTVPALQAMWDDVKTAYPNIRGMVSWDSKSNREAGGGIDAFAEAFGTL